MTPPITAGLTQQATIIRVTVRSCRSCPFAHRVGNQEARFCWLDQTQLGGGPMCRDVTDYFQLLNRPAWCPLATRLFAHVETPT